MSRSRPAKPKAQRKAAISSGWREIGLRCVGLAAVTIAVYLPIARYPFINYDDDDYILNNPHIQQGMNWPTIRWAFSHVYAANWHPLTWLVHAFDFQVYGASAGGHHVTSLLLHVVNALLLYVLLARATGFTGRSTLVAALFALHPLNVESVAWAAELKNVLCTTFFLLTLGAYGWYAKKPTVKRYAVVAFMFVLGLAAKPMVITLPFALLLLDFWPLNRIEGWTTPSPELSIPQRSPLSLAVEKLPLLLFSAGSAIVTVIGQRNGGAENMISVSRAVQLENAVYSYAMYVWKAFWPTGLAPFYPHPSGLLAPGKLIAAAVFLIAVSAFVCRRAPKRHYLVTGWLWFLGTLVPVIGLVQVGAQARADRYTYIPMIGIFAAAVWGVAEFAESTNLTQTAQKVLAPAVLVALAVLTWRQISFWDSSYDLWTHTLNVTADNPVAEHNLANELVHLGREVEAIPHLSRAVALNPNDATSAVNLGAAFSDTGRHKEAVQEYENVLRNSSDSRILLAVYQNLSVEFRLLGNQSESDEYHRHYLEAIKQVPDAVAEQLGRQ